MTDAVQPVTTTLPIQEAVVTPPAPATPSTPTPNPTSPHEYITATSLEYVSHGEVVVLQPGVRVSDLPNIAIPGLLLAGHIVHPPELAHDTPDPDPVPSSNQSTPIDWSGLIIPENLQIKAVS